MRKVINKVDDVQVMRLQCALESVRELTACDKLLRYGDTKSYRFALARRYTVCYFAFLNYLMTRVNGCQVGDESLGMEDIINRCRIHNVFGIGDERMVLQMTMMYASLSYYQEGFDGKDDTVLSDIPRMCDFIEQFVGCYTPLVPKGVPLEVMV